MCEADYIAEVCESEAPIARKQHKCSECGGVIPKGAQYIVRHGICNNEPFRLKFCFLCEAVGAHLDKRIDYVRAWGCLAEDCAEDVPADGEGNYRRGRAAIEAYARKFHCGEKFL